MDSGSDMDSQEMDRLMDDLDGWDEALPKNQKIKKVEFSKDKKEYFDDFKQEDKTLPVHKQDKPSYANSNQNVVEQKFDGNQTEFRSKAKKNLMSDLFNDELAIDKPNITAKKSSISKSLFDTVNDPIGETISKHKEDSGYFDKILSQKKKEFKSEALLDQTDSIKLADNFQSKEAIPKRRPGYSGKKSVFEIDDTDILKPKKTLDSESLNSDSNWLLQSQKQTTDAKVLVENTKSPIKKDWMSNLIGNKNSSSPTVSEPISKEMIPQNVPNSVKDNFQVNLSGNVIEANKVIGQLESQFQLKMAEYQKQQQINLLKCFQSLQTGEGALEMHENLKKLQVDLHKSEILTESLRAEVDCIKSCHGDEISLLHEVFGKKYELQKDIFLRTEEALKEENSTLKVACGNKIKLLEEEKDEQRKSSDTLLETVKADWSESLKASKEAHVQLLERVQEDNSHTIVRLSQMKDLEIKAVINANFHSQDAKMVLDHLETNVANISDITSIIAERRDEALELTKKSLDMRDRQLKSAEEQLTILRAEANQERNRLTVLIARLEDSLAQKSIDAELENWKISQSKIKFQREVQMFLENKKQLYETIEKERKSIEITKQTLLDEHEEIMEMAALHRKDLNKIPQNLMEWNRFDHRTPTMVISSKCEEDRANLDSDKVKIAAEKQLIECEKEEINLQQINLSRREAKIDEVFSSHRKLLQDINEATYNINLKEESLTEEISKLDSYRNELMDAARKNFCPSCKESFISTENNIHRSSVRFRFNETKIQQKKTNPSHILAKITTARQIEDDRRKEIKENAKILKKIFNSKTDGR